MATTLPLLLLLLLLLLLQLVSSDAQISQNYTLQERMIPFGHLHRVIFLLDSNRLELEISCQIFCLTEYPKRLYLVCQSGYLVLTIDGDFMLNDLKGEEIWKADLNGCRVAYEAMLDT